MINLLFVCAMPIIINNTKTWTDRDIQALVRASVRCGELYKSAPCAIKFYKLDELRYMVQCGVKK